MNRPVRTTLAIMLMVAAASPAWADVCTPTLPYTLPDHDQIRTAATGIVGLQNNGTQYCVPTCTSNILTYLQNHGYPALSFGAGPGPWLGTTTRYNAFGTDIEALAGLMNTDPLGGTGGSSAFTGVNQWIDNSGYTGDIVVTMVGMTLNNAPELGDIAFCLDARCPITLSVGWYSTIGTNTFVRAGGHCVSAVRLPDFCTPFQKIAIHDPGNSIGSNAFAQAAGTTETYDVQSQIMTRRDADNAVVFSGAAVRILGYGSASRSAFIDGYRAYFPAFGLSACNNPVNGSCVTQHIPNTTLTGLHSDTALPMPPNSTVLDLDIAANNASSWLLQQSQSGDFSLFRSRFGTPPAAQPFPALAPFHPRRICTGNDPHILFLLDSNPNLLVRLNTSTGLAVPISMTDAATAICFDHQHGELVLFSSAARRITRLDPNTGAPLSARTIPSTIPLGSDPRITICPKLGYIWLTSGVNTAYGLVPSPTAGTLTIAASFSTPQPLLGVDADDRGHVFTASAGQTLEFAPPPAVGGGWTSVAGGKFASLADGPIFRIARNRTNYIPAIHDTPEEKLAILPEITATPVRDCPADFNFSGDLTVQDIFDFLAAWFAGDLRADFNESNTANVQDIFDFLSAWFAGCA